MVEDGKGPRKRPLNVGEDSDSLADERPFDRSMASFGRSAFLLMLDAITEADAMQLGQIN